MISVDNRYLLKIITEEEHKAYFNLIETNRKRLIRYFPGTMKAVQDLAQARIHLAKLKEKHQQKEFYPFGIYDNENLIGWISIKNIDWRIPKGELGYYLDQHHEGKGIMSKAVSKTIHFGFEELRLEKIFLKAGVSNIGSQKIAIRNGFEKEGLFRKEWRLENGAFEDMIYFGKLK